MSYEEKINIISRKIENLDSSFSSEEIFLIEKTPHLTRKIMEAAKENDEFLLQIINLPLGLDEEFINGVSTELIIEFIHRNIVKNNFSLLGAEDYLSQEEITKLHEEIRPILLGLPNDAEFNVDAWGLNVLLEAKQYEKIANIGGSLPSDLSAQLIDRIIANFPFNQYQLPSLNYKICNYCENISDIIDKSTLEKIPLDVNIFLISKNLGDLEEENYQIIIEKIKKGYPVNDDKFSEIQGLKSFFEKISEQDRIEIFNSLLEHNCLNIIFNLEFDLDLFTEEVTLKIINAIMDGYYVKDVDAYHYLPILAREDFLVAAIKGGNLDLVSCVYKVARFSNEFPIDIDKLQQILADEVRQGNKKLLTCKSRGSDVASFLFSPELVDACLETGNYHLYEIPRHNISIWDNEEVINRLMPKIISGEVKLTISFSTPVEIFQNYPNFVYDLLKNHSIDNFFTYLNKIPHSKYIMGDKEIDILLEIMANDALFTKDLLLYYGLFIFSNPRLINFYMNNFEIFGDEVITFLEHNDDSIPYTKELYDAVKDYYTQKFELNVKHTDILAERFGYRIIRYFNYPNIIKIINLSDEAFNKLLCLFDVMPYTLVDMEIAYDAIKQYEFSKKYTKDLNIFADIMHSLQDKNDNYIELISKINTSLNDEEYIKLCDRILKEYPELKEQLKDQDTFFQYLITMINSGSSKDQEYYVNVLHMVTQYYIANLREKYRASYQMIQDLDLPYTIDEKDAINALIRYCFVNNSRLFDEKTSETISFIDLVIRKSGLNPDMVKDVLALYLHLPNYGYRYELKELKANIGRVIKCAKEVIIERREGLNFTVKQLDSRGELKREYYMPPNSIDIYSIMDSLRPELLSDGILSDDNSDAYDSLIRCLTKYKLILFPPCLSELLESDDIMMSFDQISIGSFISYFPQIYSAERQRLAAIDKDTSKMTLTLMSAIINANVYSQVSSVYSLILGEQDARLIKKNQGPNSASQKTRDNERLIEAIQWTVNNYRRMKVTVPPFVGEVETTTAQKLHVSVGNFTNPANLTHGERTGACMRIGGVGESLFEFCLENENGFHIRFEDPETGEYISRVSGFRNGNTIFLNELRNSCNPNKYSNYDVVEACRKVAQKLIELSKDSECPIENVVLHNAYATTGMSLATTEFNITNNKEGLPGFYSDIGSSGIVLATTASPSDGITPIDFDKSRVPTYLPARDKAISSANIKTYVSYINRVHSVKQLLNGVSYEYIEQRPLQSNIVYGFAYIDDKGEIHEEIIDIDKRAVAELEEARHLIKAYDYQKGDDITYAV